MIEIIPEWINGLMQTATVTTVIIFLIAVWQSVQNRKFFALTATTLGFFMIGQAVLSINGFYLAKTIPPRFPLAPVPTIIVLLILFFSFARQSISVESLKFLTLLSVVRIPVEIVLWQLYQNGFAPQLITFEGRNFDIIAGLTAPLAAWLAFRGGKINRPWLIAWHLLALALLLNVMAHAILSLESPIQQFAFEQPNRGVLYFPFIWLPSIILPAVFVSHIVSLRHLLKRKTLE